MSYCYQISECQSHGLIWLLLVETTHALASYYSTGQFCKVFLAGIEKSSPVDTTVKRAVINDVARC